MRRERHEPEPSHVDVLFGAVERRIARGTSPARLSAELRELARSSTRGSRPHCFAHRHLARLTVGERPWRAALHARRVLAHEPNDDEAWGLLGLSLSLLGHARAAVRAYERALALAPDNPYYAHNLGHLYDVALHEPGRGVPLLLRATTSLDDAEVASSLAHALGRVGRVSDAQRVLEGVRLRGGHPPLALRRWIASGAPVDEQGFAEIPRDELADGRR
jgi:tetratricopeptide (TPR) repeat protein